MALDIRLLQCIRDRDTFKKLYGAIPAESLDQTTRILVEDIREYYNKFDIPSIDGGSFITWALTVRHPKMAEQTQVVYKHLVTKMLEEPPSGIREPLLNELHELRLVTDLANALTAWEAGELPDAPQVFSQALRRYKVNTMTSSDSYITDDIDALLDVMQDNCGIQWRLDSLNFCMRGLRPGDFGIIAARPDRGKSTFFASEVTFMATQLPDDKNIIWLNNEGMGKRIIPRLYQAALGCTLSELVQKRDSGTLQVEYMDAVGRLDKIRVYDIHGMNIGQVERIIENSSPGIVVVDMIDNIRHYKVGERSDQQLESMYQWFREMCTGLEFIGLASSQISAEGDGLAWPSLSMLKDSKTGKQGACDFQLMIGARNDPVMDCERYLGLVKNKLRREGAPSNPQATVHFNPTISRYMEIQDE